MSALKDLDKKNAHVRILLTVLTQVGTGPLLCRWPVPPFCKRYMSVLSIRHVLSEMNHVAFFGPVLSVPPESRSRRL